MVSFRRKKKTVCFSYLYSFQLIAWYLLMTCLLFHIKTHPRSSCEHEQLIFCLAVFKFTDVLLRAGKQLNLTKFKTCSNVNLFDKKNRIYLQSMNVITVIPGRPHNSLLLHIFYNLQQLSLKLPLVPVT